MIDYIKIADCEKGFVYQIRSRNLTLGVFNGNAGFIGIREKFGNEYLFTEYHYDSGAPFGTVFPIKKLEKLPDDIPLSEFLRTIDKKTKKKVAFDEGWYFVKSGILSNKIVPVSVRNNKLFNYLKKHKGE